MNKNKVVAIVGRPNVGKSRLFNRLAHRRISIVHDKPGVTRDMVTIDMPEGYTLIDTGGIGLEDKETPKAISEAMRTQAMIAVEMADIILFVTDAREGVTPLDTEIAQSLRNRQNKVITVANKLDNPDRLQDALEFAQLGFGTPFAVSAEHNFGLNELEDAFLERMAPLTPSEKESHAQINIALVGKPNAGKSSLGNRMLNSERFIVSEVAGTTRDMVETQLEYTDRKGASWSFRMVDTAGLRPKKKMDSSVEYFSSVRTHRSIARADVVLHLVDAKDGVTKQDKIIAGQILDAGKALVIVVTKWDHALNAFRNGEIDEFDDLYAFREAYTEALKKQFFYLPDSPVVYTSALDGNGIQHLLDQVIAVHKTLDTRLPTPKLNRVLAELVERRPPPKVSGKRFKIFYAVQSGNRPFRLKIFCNRAERLQEPYRRYLEKNLIQAFSLSGCPFQFHLLGKEERYRNLDD